MLPEDLGDVLRAVVMLGAILCSSTLLAIASSWTLLLLLDRLSVTPALSCLAALANVVITWGVGLGAGIWLASRLQASVMSDK